MSNKRDKEFWKNYDGTEGSDDFWNDYDMWQAMRDADETAITKAEADADLEADIELALNGGKPRATAPCRKCGNKYGHSPFCPDKDKAVIYLDHYATRRADATAAFSAPDYKALSKVGRGGPDAKTGTKPTAVIVDMDGTIDVAGKPHPQGMAYVRDAHKNGHVIIILTARTHDYEYERTHKWCTRELTHKYAIPFVGPFCRAADDKRWACDFKKAMYDTLSGVYDILGAIDDDRWCLAKWRSVKGLEVVEAVPTQWVQQPYRRSAKRKNAGQPGRHRTPDKPGEGEQLVIE